MLSTFLLILGVVLATASVATASAFVPATAPTATTASRALPFVVLLVDNRFRSELTEGVAFDVLEEATCLLEEQEIVCDSFVGHHFQLDKVRALLLSSAASFLLMYPNARQRTRAYGASRTPILEHHFLAHATQLLNVCVVIRVRVRVIAAAFV